MSAIKELPIPLSAKFSQSFAYETVKDRIPRILTKTIDVCHRIIPTFQTQHGEEGRKDAIAVVAKLSKLRNEIMTDKAISSFTDANPDVELWDTRLKEYCESHGCDPTWFSASWLYVECYVYRRITNALYTSKYMKNFDPFSEQKTQALQQSIPAIHNLGLHLNQVLETTDLKDMQCLKQHFIDLLQISLWGNKCDLSISGGEENSQSSADLHKNLETLREFLLIDDSNCIWEKLQEVRKSNEKVRVDIVLDNAGFELCSDLILADFMLSVGLCDQVVLHPKSMPWFVSDVTSADFTATLTYLQSLPTVAFLSKKWNFFIANKQLLLNDENELLKFWSLPDPYCKMKTACPDLYKHISFAALVIFKGDLNYRKLVGDLDWPHDTDFKQALQGFQPTCLCSLRTLKADVVVGLKKDVAEKVEIKDKDWMVSGQYGLIQYSEGCAS